MGNSKVQLSKQNLNSDETSSHANVDEGNLTRPSDDELQAING